MARRLSDSSSQYLQQHAHQLVDWFPYGQPAFDAARERGVPVMLSIGYSSCHWCHVMSHESFDDPAVAELINQNFVAIKVDREEHPLVDDTYMMATQALTGAGGWPMTIFALPDGRAFHTGTYYPPTPRGKMPSFTQVLRSIAAAWAESPERIEEQARLISEHLAELSGRQEKLFALRTETPAAQALGQAAEHWTTGTRPEGGLGPAPKFPPTWMLTTMWHLVFRGGSRSGTAFNALATTLEAIVAGGLRDHLNGGFARYCVDEQWSVPHFEKMLYDNAGLLALCAQSAVLAEEVAPRLEPEEQSRARQLASVCRAAAYETVDFLRTEMLTGGPEDPHRAFASSLDADALRGGHLVEGAYYTFSRSEISSAAEAVQRLPAGLIRLAEVAEDPGNYCLSLHRLPQADEEGMWDEFTGKLRGIRSSHARPARDEKIIAGWNGLTIDALCRAGELFGEETWIELAAQSAQSVWDVHWDGRLGTLARISSHGTAQQDNEATLQDYSAMALSFLSLARVRPSEPWSERADALLARATDFIDTAASVAYDAVDLDERLAGQRHSTLAASMLEDALPAAGSLYAKALTRRAVLAMERHSWTAEHEKDLQLADELTAHSLALADQAPTQVATALSVQALLSAPAQYVTVSDGAEAEIERLRRICRALELGLRVDPEQQPSAKAMLIQPCRALACSMPRQGIDDFLNWFATS